MATTTTTRRKTPCSKCDKAAGIFTCRGCQKDFCYRHVAEHRQELNKEMDEVVTKHDQLKQTIAEQESQPMCHPLIKRISEWEEKSIEKIRQAANNARKDVLDVVSAHRKRVTINLTSVTQEMNKGRDEDDYVETDIKEWMERLEKLRKDLNAAETIDFGENNSNNALIAKIFINDVSGHFFDQNFGDIQILENGKVALRCQTGNNMAEYQPYETYGQVQQLAIARGRMEYSSGQHRLRFKLECLNGNGDFACGIASKNMSMESIVNISTNICAYRWKSHNSKFFHAQTNSIFYINSRSFIGQDSTIVELLIDCDQRMIHFTHEHTGQKQRLNINLNSYPFPWQFFIILLNLNDRVRLCDEKNS